MYGIGTTLTTQGDAHFVWSWESLVNPFIWLIIMSRNSCIFCHIFDHCIWHLSVRDLLLICYANKSSLVGVCDLFVFLMCKEGLTWVCILQFLLLSKKRETCTLHKVLYFSQISKERELHTASLKSLKMGWCNTIDRVQG